MVWRVLVFVIAVFLSACSTTPTIERAKHLPSRVGPQEESVVFGKITVVEEGEEQIWGVPNGVMGFLQEFRVSLLPEGTYGAEIFALKGNGRFFWSLAPGTYRILGFERSIGSRSRGGRIDARFTVPKGKANVYIGDLVMIVTDGRFEFSVKDDYDIAVNKLRKLFPGVKGAFKTALLTFVKPPGSYSRVLGICSEFSGDDKCDWDHQGLVPVTPKASENFPVVSSLTPKFEWKPSSRDDVTYDLVIYDAALIKSEEFPEYTPAHVLLYEENLKQPNFELKQPLKPSRRYYWSVRLRHGQDVSSWSRHGYSSFNMLPGRGWQDVSSWSHDGYSSFDMILGRKWKAGLWFTFETPSGSS